MGENTREKLKGEVTDPFAAFRVSPPRQHLEPDKVHGVLCVMIGVKINAAFSQTPLRNMG